MRPTAVPIRLLSSTWTQTAWMVSKVSPHQHRSNQGEFGTARGAHPQAVPALFVSLGVFALVATRRTRAPSRRCAPPAMMGKKKGGKPKSARGGGQEQREKKATVERRLDEQTKQFMFTILGLTKSLPDGLFQLPAGNTRAA